MTERPHPERGPVSDKEKAAKAFTAGMNRLFARHHEAVETTHVEAIMVETLNLVQSTPQGSREMTLSRHRREDSHLFTKHTLTLQPIRSSNGDAPHMSHEYTIEEGVVQHRDISAELDMSAFFAPETTVSIAQLEAIMQREGEKEDNAVTLAEVQELMRDAEKAELAPVTFEALILDHMKSTQQYPPTDYESILTVERFKKAVEAVLRDHEDQVIIRDATEDDSKKEMYYSHDEEHHFGMAVGKTMQIGEAPIYHVIAVKQDDPSSTLSFHTETEQVVSQLNIGQEIISEAVMGFRRMSRLQRFMHHPTT